MHLLIVLLEIISKLNNSVEVFIIGGASNSTFEKMGHKSTSKLKQKNTEY